MKCIKSENLLLIMTIVGVLSGIGLGIGLKFGMDRTPTLSPREVAYLRFPGEIFLRMLKMLILPLITSSLINSLASLDSETAGRMGLVATIYYMSTTLIAVITGIVLVVIIKPGSYAETIKTGSSEGGESCKGTEPLDTIMDLFRNMFPENIEVAGFQSTHTCVRYTQRDNESVVTTINWEKWSNLTESEQEMWDVVPYQSMKDGMNILGLVIFSLVFGFIINRMGETALPLANFFRALEAVIMRMVTIVIWLSPVGILFLIASEIIQMDDLVKELQRLAMYIVTVLAGLFIHACITLPILLITIGRRNPLKFTYGMLQALLTAFGTSSSSATMSITLECLEQNNHIDKRVTRFVIPLGATINMDGTALYEAVAAIYIAQSVGEEMTVGKVILISLTATLASIGAAGIPQAGLVTMIMVLVAVGLDPSLFTLIISIDWLLDRVRTMVNVHGDSYGAGIVQTLCQKQLDKVPDAGSPDVKALAAAAGTDRVGDDGTSGSSVFTIEKEDDGKGLVHKSALPDYSSLERGYSSPLKVQTASNGSAKNSSPLQVRAASNGSAKISPQRSPNGDLVSAGEKLNIHVDNTRV